MKNISNTLFIVSLILALTVINTIASAEEHLIITLPNELKVIEEESFYGTKSIEKVIIPDGTTFIGSRAFADSSIKEIVIPDSVESIEEDAFEGCNNLMVVANSGTYAYRWAEKHGFNIIPTKPTPAEDFAYTIGSNGIKITGYAGNSKTLMIPDEIDGVSVVSISGNAFYNNTRLEYVYIPDSVTVIDNGSTYGFGDGTFYGCENLKTVRLPRFLKEISTNLFHNCTSLVSIEIPNTVTRICESGFYGCKSLVSVSLPESLTTLAHRAFAQCTNLKSIQMPKEMLSIGEWAFAGCESLESMVIPYGIKALEMATFDDCKSLTNVVIPETVTRVGKTGPGNIYSNPFIGCSNLKQIVLPSNISAATKYLSGEIIDYICPANSLSAKTLGQVEVRFVSPNATDYLLQMHSSGIALGITKYYGTEPVPTIPTTIDGIRVNRILGAAFANNEYVRAVTIPDSIISVEDYAFYNCSVLEEIFIPRSVTEIGDNAFENCSARIKCNNGSYAQMWAEENGLSVFVVEE